MIKSIKTDFDMSNWRPFIITKGKGDRNNNKRIRRTFSKNRVRQTAFKQARIQGVGHGGHGPSSKRRKIQKYIFINENAS